MAREPRQTTSRRDRAVEQERRERERRERDRRRASSPARDANERRVDDRRSQARRAGRGEVSRPSTAAAAAPRERHEGLVSWVVRGITGFPAAVGAALRGFALELVGVLGGIGRALLSLVPGSSRITGAGKVAVERARTTRQGRSSRSDRVEPLDDAPGSGRRPARPVRTPAQQRAAEQRRARTRARLRLALVAGLVVSFVAAWVFVPASNAFRIRHVEVTGTSAVGDLEVRRQVDELLAGETVFTVDDDAVARRIEQLPFVSDARVERHLPGGLQLHVREYRPLALGAGDGKYWLVAPDGRVLARARRDEWLGRIPLVTLQGSDIAPGDRVADEPALRLLTSRGANSTLRFTSVDANRYVVTAQLEDGVELRFGRPQELIQKVRVAEAMLRRAARKDTELLYVDVSVPGKPAICAKADPLCRLVREDPDDAAAAVAKGAGKAAKAASTTGATSTQAGAATTATTTPTA